VNDAPIARFTSAPAPEALALGRSLSFDVRLAPHDVDASVAHVQGLRDAGLLDEADAAALAEALVAVGHLIAEGAFAFDPADEDVHSAIERGVTDRLGDVGARLHAGRSRNDLVVTDLRLWLLAAGRRIDGLVAMFVRTLVAHAREHAETVMPGTTHARPARMHATRAPSSLTPRSGSKSFGRSPGSNSNPSSPPMTL
jgi:argininosuccinate lyase